MCDGCRASRYESGPALPRDERSSFLFSSLLLHREGVFPPFSSRIHSSTLILAHTIQLARMHFSVRQYLWGYLWLERPWSVLPKRLCEFSTVAGSSWSFASYFRERKDSASCTARWQASRTAR